MGFKDLCFLSVDEKRPEKHKLGKCGSYGVSKTFMQSLPFVVTHGNTLDGKCSNNG